MIDEVIRREKVAIEAIRSTFGTEDGEYGVNLFVSHCLDELESEYWQKHLGTKTPDPARILDILKLRKHWGGDDGNGLENYDFTLPDDITNYVICVNFNDESEVDDISMES